MEAIQMNSRLLTGQIFFSESIEANNNNLKR